MNIANTPIRRTLTLVGVAAALVVGFGAIRASAAWTATTAPLMVAPVSAETLQARLNDESARSAALVDRLAALTTRAEELSAALAAAQDRIGSDADHAAQLAKDLDTAKKKLAALEKSIHAASAVRAIAPATAARTTSSASTPGGEHEGGSDD
jgi:chromosome segregation ATPase